MTKINIKKFVIYEDHTSFTLVKRLRPGKGWKHPEWRISNINDALMFQIRINGRHRVVYKLEEFYNGIKEHYQQDLELLLFHPEILRGKYETTK